MPTKNTGRFEFTDAPFRRSHMRSPRGRGAWAFQLTSRRTAFDDEALGPIVWTPSMTFGDAKRWVKANQPEGLYAVLS